jgi:hypothetical protein
VHASREGRVARRVDERDQAVGVCTWYAPMCCVMPPASPAPRSCADVVEQRGLAVVDVTHDGDDRRAGRLRLSAVPEATASIVFLQCARRVAELLDDELRRVLVDRLVDRRHDAHLHHGLDDFVGLDAMRWQVADGDRLGQLHLALDRAVGISKPCSCRRCRGRARRLAGPASS